MSELKVHRLRSAQILTDFYLYFLSEFICVNLWTHLTRLAEGGLFGLGIIG